jgi:hypothetical protein
MSQLRTYLRVIGLLAPEKGLASLLLLANLALAATFFLEPWLLGRVVDALSAAAHGDAWHWIGCGRSRAWPRSLPAPGSRCTPIAWRTGGASP